MATAPPRRPVDTRNVHHVVPRFQFYNTTDRFCFIGLMRASAARLPRWQEALSRHVPPIAINTRGHGKRVTCLKAYERRPRHNSSTSPYPFAWRPVLSLRMHASLMTRYGYDAEALGPSHHFRAHVGAAFNTECYHMPLVAPLNIITRRVDAGY